MHMVHLGDSSSFLFWEIEIKEQETHFKHLQNYRKSAGWPLGWMITQVLSSALMFSTIQRIAEQSGFMHSKSEIAEFLAFVKDCDHVA